MPSVNTFLKALEKGDQIKDAKHASKLFVDNNYELQPRFQHLFAVVFNFTPDAAQLFNSVEKMEIPMLVKTIDLPGFSIQTETHNQYNKQTHSQHKINYSPVNIAFHDDQKDLIRSFFHTYQNYYYKDSSHQLGSGKYNTENKYTGYQNGNWGFAQGNTRFFKDIRVYSMYQKRFAEYTLINPIVTNLGHDSHAYASGGLMQHTMSINYEAVKYSTGFVNNINPKGFGEIHYDKSPSPLGTRGGLVDDTVLFQGGLLDAAGSIARDLFDGNILGAVIKGGVIFNEAKDLDLGAVLEKDGTRILGSILRGENPLNDIIVPTPQGSQTLGGTPPIRGTVDRNANPSANVVTSNGSSVLSNLFRTPRPDPDINIGSSKVVPNRNGTVANPNNIGDIFTNLFTGGSNANQPTTKKNELTDRLAQLNSRIAKDSPGQTPAFIVRERNELQQRIDLEFGRQI